jgi:hypothetical protein
MATWEDVRRIALALPATEEQPSARGRAFWQVKGKSFAWERPLRGTELRALGDTAPDGPILGARVEHQMAKDALLGDNPEIYFTTPHFDGHASVLIRLEKIDADELREVLIEAWLVRAPKRLAQEFIETTLKPPGNQVE